MLKWVSDCKTSLSGPYHKESDSTCYNLCENYYKDLECVESCDIDIENGPYIYKDESTKICYKECPSNLGKGFYNDNKQCQSCNLGEGYYRANDKRCYSGENFCEFGSQKYYYNYDDNYCFEKECKDYSKYKYHAFGGYKCHKSCSEFNTDTEKYLFEKNYICYKDAPEISGEDSFQYKYRYFQVL